MTILQRLQTLLGVTDKDALLTILIEDAQIEFKNYCNRTDVPEATASLITQMVIYRYNQLGSEGIASQSYSGISQSFTSTYPENIIKQLNTYRKLKVM
jgi:hypothetical protein